MPISCKCASRSTFRRHRQIIRGDLIGPRRVLLLGLDSRSGTDLVGRARNDEVTGLQGAEDLDHTPLCRASTDVDPLGPSVADKDDEDSLSRCFDGTAVQIS